MYLQILNEFGVSTEKTRAQYLYRTGWEAQGFEKSEADKMLEKKLIKAAKSEWAAPPVFAPKKKSHLDFVRTFEISIQWQNTTPTPYPDRTSALIHSDLP